MWGPYREGHGRGKGGGELVGEGAVWVCVSRVCGPC